MSGFGFVVVSRFEAKAAHPMQILQNSLSATRLESKTGWEGRGVDETWDAPHKPLVHRAGDGETCRRTPTKPPWGKKKKKRENSGERLVAVGLAADCCSPWSSYYQSFVQSC